MSLEMWLFLGVIACGLLVCYLYRRSQKEGNKNRKDQANDTDTVDHADDDYEDMLLTGVMLSEIYNNDDGPSDDKGSDGFDGVDDGGGFGDGGFDGGGFDGGDGGAFE